MRKWRIEDSEELYNITGWGTSYFGINDKGHVVVTPRKDGVSVDLKELVDELQLRDVASPMLVRFPDILDNRIEKMRPALNRQPRSMVIKPRTLLFIRLRSTRCALWWKKLSATERSSISDWKPALNRNSMR